MIGNSFPKLARPSPTRAPGAVIDVLVRVTAVSETAGFRSSWATASRRTRLTGSVMRSPIQCDGGKRKMQRGKIILAAVLALASLAANSTGYHVFKKVALPGAGGWDYLTVDESARRLYVSHATQVVVLDADSLEIVGKIPDLSGVHGIAVAPEFGRGFITAGQMDRVIVFDLKTLSKIGEVKV